MSDGIIRLLEDLGQPAEPFMQSWEYGKYIAAKREVLRELATHQSNKHVYKFFALLDAESRGHASWEQTVQRAVALAPITLGFIQDDLAEAERSKKNYNLAKV